MSNTKHKQFLDSGLITNQPTEVLSLLSNANYLLNQYLPLFNDFVIENNLDVWQDKYRRTKKVVYHVSLELIDEDESSYNQKFDTFLSCLKVLKITYSEYVKLHYEYTRKPDSFTCEVSFRIMVESEEKEDVE